MVVAVAEERDVRLYPIQYDFVEDQHRYVAFIGGRNSGKTYAGSWKAVTKAQQGGLGIIAAPDFPMLELGAKRQFIQRLDELRVPYHFTGTGGGHLSIPYWGAEVRFATLETPARVRGPNYWWAWPDEIEYLTDQEIWKALKGAVREGPNPQIFPTSTPKGRRLIYHEWVVNKTFRHKLYRATTHDNPYIDADDYVSALGYEGRYYEQEITAEFVGFEGLVYPAFDRSRHIQPRDCDGWNTILGVDAGTRNPSAIITIRYVGDARHQEREFYQRGMGSTDLLAAVKAEADTAGRTLTSIQVDPSAAGLIVDLDEAGYPVNKANNNVTDGIREVTTALEHGFTIDPSCIHTIDEYESYAYPDNTTREDDKPVKQNDHCMDATRYALMGLAVPEPQYWIA